MSKRISYAIATPQDAAWLGSRLRPADVAEVKAAIGLTPERAVEVSFRASTCAVTALWNGEPAGMFGIVPVSTLDGVGAPWMLGTDRADMLAREWLVEAPQWLKLLGDGYFVLRNWVDARNVRSIVWLRRMGFKIEKAEPWGTAGLPFHRFERRV